MKKILSLCVVLLAVALLGGCDGDKIKALNDQVAALAGENTTLKAKIGDLEKARTEMAGTLSVLQADRDLAKKAIEECAAKDKPRDAAAPKDGGPKGKNDATKATKGATDGKAVPSPATKGKPSFKGAKKVGK